MHFCTLCQPLCTSNVTCAWHTNNCKNNNSNNSTDWIQPFRILHIWIHTQLILSVWCTVGCNGNTHKMTFVKFILKLPVRAQTGHTREHTHTHWHKLQNCTEQIDPLHGQIRHKKNQNMSMANCCCYLCGALRVAVVEHRPSTEIIHRVHYFFISCTDFDVWIKWNYCTYYICWRFATKKNCLQFKKKINTKMFNDCKISFFCVHSDSVWLMAMGEILPSLILSIWF